MPTSTYTPLANITLGSAVASVTLSSINQGYRDLVLIANIRTERASTTDATRMRFNSDTGANYNRVGMYGAGSTGSFTNSNVTYLVLNSVGSTATSNYFEPNIISIMDYSATDKHKTTLNRESEATSTTVTAQAGRWANTSAITSISFVNDTGANFSIGSSFALYGIAS